LMRMNIDGSDNKNLFEMKSEMGSARLSPDGRLIFYIHSTGTAKPNEAVVVPVAGGEEMFHMSLSPIMANFNWSPDSKAIEYVLTRNGVSNIWEQPIAGGAPHQVTQFTSGLIFGFTWSQDGKQLAVGRGRFTSNVILMRNFE